MNFLAMTLLLVAVQSGVHSGRTPSGIAYDVQGSGPVVVLISGSNLDRRMWNAETRWLRERYKVVRYDLRAHGQSDVPTKPFSHLDDLLEVLDALEISKATLIGLSAGSTIALDAALEAPARVERIVLVAPGISGYVPRERPAFFADLIAALRSRDYVQAQEVMLASPLFTVPPESRAFLRTMVTENNRLWTVPRELIQGLQPPAAERLKDVKAPTLVLVGDRDLAPQLEQADVLAQQITGARLVIIAGGGHMLNLTSRDAFRAEVWKFLAKDDR
jgi:pimeloyl-ACP methyl ester carboxylesterase